MIKRHTCLISYIYKGETAMNKIIIVGAVAGGATCASQIRRLDKESEIIVLKKIET